MLEWLYDWLEAAVVYVLTWIGECAAAFYAAFVEDALAVLWVRYCEMWGVVLDWGIEQIPVVCCAVADAMSALGFDWDPAEVMNGLGVLVTTYKTVDWLFPVSVCVGVWASFRVVGLVIRFIRFGLGLIPTEHG